MKTCSAHPMWCVTVSMIVRTPYHTIYAGYGYRLCTGVYSATIRNRPPNDAAMPPFLTRVLAHRNVLCGRLTSNLACDGQLHPCQYPALIGTFLHVDAKFTTSTMLQTRHRQGRPPRCRLDVSQPAQLLAARRDNLIRPYCRCATHCPPTPTTNMTPQENGLLSYLQNCKTMLALRRHRSWTSTGWALKSMHHTPHRIDPGDSVLCHYI